MQPLLIRLEIIKHGIVLGDEDLILTQLSKLPPSDDPRVLTIVHYLQEGEFARAVALIEEFLSRQTGLVVYEDAEIAGLRLELKSLEAQLLLLEEEKQNAQQLLNEFNIQYTLALGDVIQGILDFEYLIRYQKVLNKLKHRERLQQAKARAEERISALKEEIKDLLAEDLDHNQLRGLSDLVNELIDEVSELESLQDEIDAFDSEMNEDEEYQAYQEAKAEKTEFEEEIEELREQQEHELPEEDKARLKQAYRKASRLCHPDMVADEFKERAHEIMTKLNVAKDNQDLAEVERILALLESGAGFVASSDRIDNIAQLKGKIEELRHHIRKLQAEIEAITKDELYQKITALDDWPEYFASVKVDLEARLAELKQQYEQLLSEDAAQVYAPAPASTQSKPKRVDEEDAFWEEEFQKTSAHTS